MIRLVDSTRVYGDGEPTLKIYADTQDEVESGEIIGWSGQVPAGSTIYTADGSNGIYKSDGTVAWQGGNPQLASFTIHAFGEDFGYNFEQGMTWGEFITSSYNEEELFSGDEYDKVNYEGGVVGDDVGDPVFIDQEIVADFTYYRDET